MRYLLIPFVLIRQALKTASNGFWRYADWIEEKADFGYEPACYACGSYDIVRADLCANCLPRGEFSS